MGLNVAKGNMYQGWITHTWNTIKGKCHHDCSYCYMKRWKNLKKARFDNKELKTDLGSGNFIFVGSSNDLFNNNIPYEWMIKTLEHCKKYSANKYLFQTKDTQEMSCWLEHMPDNSAVCTTLETNRNYPEYMGNSPNPFTRALHFKGLVGVQRYITIEPIMDFDLGAFTDMIRAINPVQVNIGADSGDNNLPEPEWEKIERLIKALSRFTIVKEKPNLDRLRKSAIKQEWRPG
ncbi:DUF5131 family protein [Candidatus Pacearchaeota archaeon]|nr:DUF5131 family protein [Candidatus Pacearchaeota archaeon]